MAMATEENLSNLNTLKEMILDEGKLVTYISISRDLCIHINSSKSLIKVLLETLRREQPKLHLNINYLISGLIDDNIAKVTVCPEDELENLKKTFKKVFFQHIYSVSNGKPHVDPAAFVSLNKYSDFNLCSGVIKNENCIKRSSEEINHLISSSQGTIKIQRPIISSQKKNIIEPIVKAVNTIKVEKCIKTEPIKKELVSPRKENINKLSVKPAAQKGITGFFNKQNGHTKKKDTKSSENLQCTISKEENGELEKMDTEDIEEVEIKVKTEVKKENGTNGNNKVLHNIKKNSKVDKKRKRVLHVSDSESDEENDPFVRQDTNENSHESEDEIPPTPALNHLKITTGIVNPRKKRKVVDKTYMDDNGYIITKREEVYESCSDNENSTEKELVKQEVKKEKIEISPINKTSDKKTFKKKNSPTQKGKQPTLMNFFKKK